MPHATPAQASPQAGPGSDEAVALADRCVQCGLCLPVCPTYTCDRLEPESPRGRIALARAWALGAVEPTPVGDLHLDHCLGCRNCEAVCPAGVEYGALLNLARVQQRARRGTNLRQRGAEWLVMRPRLLRALLRLYRIAHPILPAGLRALPRPPAWTRAGATPPLDVRGGHRVGLFVGCVADRYEPAARDALARLCTAAGFELVAPTSQGCCGSMHVHAGNAAAASTLAARNRDAFAGCTTVLTLASGCHEAVAASLEVETVDALTFLDAHRARLRFGERRERVALHLPCTQRNVVRSVPALRRLLAAVPGLEVVELDAGSGCCGAAGTAMLTDPTRADDYRRPLLEQFAASGASRLLSANIGCRLHLGNGSSAQVLHPVELLAEALLPLAPGDHRAGLELPRPVPPSRHP